MTQPDRDRRLTAIFKDADALRAYFRERGWTIHMEDNGRDVIDPFAAIIEAVPAATQPPADSEGSRAMSRHGPNDGCGELLWEHMSAEPGFSEDIRQAEAELAEGRGVPFAEERAVSPVADPESVIRQRDAIAEDEHVLFIQYEAVMSEAALVDALKYAAASTNQSLDTTPYAVLSAAMKKRLERTAQKAFEEMET